MIKGVKAKYAHHTNINDQNIKLGSFYNPESLLIKSVTGIDFHFKGEAFSKVDLTILGKKVVENRQPIHAIIDMFLHFGYIDRVCRKQYKRTEKKLPKPPLDIFRNLYDLEPISSEYGIGKIEK